MASKIARAAERKVFSTVTDQLIKAGKSEDRDQKLDKILNMAEKLLKDTNPNAVPGIREAIYPGSKWEKYLWSFINDTDPNVLKGFILNGGYEASFRGLRDCTYNAEKYQCNVPWIVLFDPTSACNKQCVGCWAADYENQLNLSYETLDRFITEAEELGTHLFMLTGGEPLVRKDDVLKLAEKHNTSLFNIFTNASLVDQKLCDEVKRLGNIVFSVSVEGTRDSNDERRGDGSYDEVMSAMELMKKNGLIFGTSTAYTRYNIDEVSSDEYFDNIIDHGARWAWFFHYMPVGAGAEADLMPTIEQREYMLHRIREVRENEGGKAIFAMDFQNDGEFVGGCIAGGRMYCHVNARGDVEPCVFIHYSNANINEQSWLECLQQPLFQCYRKHYPWNDNMLQPCPMLENPDVLPEIVHEACACSTEYVTPESVDDLCARTTPYAASWVDKANELWLKDHPTGKKVYDNEMANAPTEVKAAVIAAEDEEATLAEEMAQLED